MKSVSLNIVLSACVQSTQSDCCVTEDSCQTKCVDSQVTLRDSLAVDVINSAIDGGTCPSVMPSNVICLARQLNVRPSSPAVAASTLVDLVVTTSTERRPTGADVDFATV